MTAFQRHVAPPGHGEHIRSRAWKKKRIEALNAAGHACIRCGKTTSLVVHHNTYANFKNEKMEDLDVLCKSCHIYTHIEITKREDKIIADEWGVSYE